MYQCNYKSNIENHIKLHIKYVHAEVLYSCSLCVYKTLQEQNLISHFKMDHEGLHTYDICAFTFRFKSEINKHIKLEHYRKRNLLILNIIHNLVNNLHQRKKKNLWKRKKKRRKKMRKKKVF